MAYATRADLAAWVGSSQTLPDTTEQDRLLERASTIVDGLLVAAVYDVDSDGNPIDTDVAAALSDATCAQVEWWLESGDELGASASWASVSIGSVRLGGGQGESGASAPAAAPRATSRLQLAGLLPGTPAIGPG
jgi:hypothetical protein